MHLSPAADAAAEPKRVTQLPKSARTRSLRLADTIRRIGYVKWSERSELLRRFRPVFDAKAVAARGAGVPAKAAGAPDSLRIGTADLVGDMRNRARRGPARNEPQNL